MDMPVVIFIIVGDSMRLYLKRDKSSEKYDFVFFDELGEEKYRAYFKKAVGSAKMNLIVETTANGVAAKIRRLPIVGTRTFVFKVGKSHVTFVMVPTQKGIYSYFYGNNWHIGGDIATKNFQIIDVDKSVILNHTRCPDYCLLEIPNPDNELYCVATSICANLINIIDKPAVKAVNI